MVKLIGSEGKSSVFSRVEQMPERLRALLTDQLIILRLPIVRTKWPSKRQTIENHSNLSHLVQRSFHRHNYTLFVWQLIQLRNHGYTILPPPPEKRRLRVEIKAIVTLPHKVTESTACSEERVKRTRNVFATIGRSD